MIRVFLLDDHEVVRRGLTDLVEAEPDMTVVGEAAGVSDLLVAVARSEPDVAVLDLRLADGNGSRPAATSGRRTRTSAASS